MTDELIQTIAPGCCEAMRKSLYSLDNPWQSLHKMHALIGSISSQLADQCLIVSTPTKRNPDSSSKLHLLGIPLVRLDEPIKHSSVEIINHSEVTVDVATASADNGSSSNNTLSLSMNHVAVDDDDDEVVERSKRLYLDETIELMFDRWDQINKSFFDKKNKKFDLTKVPDVSDMVSHLILQ